jgi:hypothetical protein
VTQLYENAVIADIGFGGYEQNIYIDGPGTATFRGVRSIRTLGNLDGHLFKSRCAVNDIQGCAFVSSGPADNTRLVQFANGGTATLIGNLLVQGAATNDFHGSVIFENESTDTPWYYPSVSHSLTVRKNVFVSRMNGFLGWYGEPFVYIREAAHAYGTPITSGNITISDNVGTNAGTNIGDGTGWQQNYIQSDFSKSWVPTNTLLAYDAADSVFTEPLLEKYLVAAGPISGGTLSTHRFVHPARFIPRDNDSSRGLG